MKSLWDKGASVHRVQKWIVQVRAALKDLFDCNVKFIQLLESAGMPEEEVPRAQMYYVEAENSCSEVLKLAEHRVSVSCALNLSSDKFEDEINPEHSVSQTSGSTKRSSSTTAYSARLKATAKKAALIARAQVLDDSLELKRKQLQLQHDQEQLNLRAKISEVEAEENVYRMFEEYDGRSDCISHVRSSAKKLPLNPNSVEGPTALKGRPVAVGISKECFIKFVCLLRTVTSCVFFSERTVRLVVRWKSTGCVWSPSCASFAPRRVADDHRVNFPEETIQTVKRNFYADDCHKSVGTNEEAINIVHNLCHLLALVSFRLTKWISNDRRVLEAIPVEERVKGVKNLDLDHSSLPVERALGIHWNTESDQFGVQIKSKQREFLLSEVSSVYDLLGLVCPFVLRAKTIFQDECKSGKEWDDPLSQENQVRWSKWLEELPLLGQFKVKRCLVSAHFGKPVKFELHHFCDASLSAYGSVTYLRAVNAEGEIHCWGSQEGVFLTEIQKDKVLSMLVSLLRPLSTWEILPRLPEMLISRAEQKKGKYLSYEFNNVTYYSY
ncbi:hypothetical protein ACROYT_G016747 [Oculina patagonica]